MTLCLLTSDTEIRQHKKSDLLKSIQQYFYLPFIKPLRYFTKNEYVKKDIHFVNKKNHKTKFSP